MAGIRQPVDAFFETVLVMAKEEAIRNNRLALLAEISALFHRVADFAKIVTGGARSGERARFGAAGAGNRREF